MVLTGIDIQELKGAQLRDSLFNSVSVFTQYELAYKRGKREPNRTACALFCAKEAIFKCIFGLKHYPRFGYLDVEIKHSPNGRPYPAFNNALGNFIQSVKAEFDISISHSGNYCIASCVLSVHG